MFRASLIFSFLAFISFFSTTFAWERTKRIIPECLAAHSFLNQVKYVLHEQEDNLTQQEQEVFSIVDETLNLMINISNNLNSDQLFYNPEIEVGFLGVCQSFISLEKLKLHHLRTLRNRILCFNKKIEKYIYTRNSCLKEADLKLLENIKKLNDLLLDHFLNEDLLNFGFYEKLADWFFYLPKEIVSRNKGLVCSVLTAGLVACSYFIYPYLKKFFSNDNEKGKVNNGVCVVNIAGLRNLGVTCYINSVLQCIYNTEPLKESLLKLRDNPDNSILISELIKVVNQLETSDGVIDPTKFVKLAREQLFRKKDQRGQNDAQEFLNQLFVELSKTDKFENMFRVETQIEDECSSCKTFFAENYKKELRDPAKEVIFNLSLGEEKLGKCLGNCFELLKGEVIEEYNCEKCGREGVELIRNTYISNISDVVVIALKRFSYDGKKTEKRKDPITFPLLELDLSSNLSPEAGAAERDKRYDLTGFVCHSGSLDGGHYISYAKNTKQDKWYKCNDSSCREVEPDIVKEIAEDKGTDDTFTPYILFYQIKKIKD